MSAGQPALKTIPVSDLIFSINRMLKTRSRLDLFLISGELSNVKYVNGHCYFNLKDDKAQIACNLWRSNARKAGFELKDGMAVLCHGSVEIYDKRGSLQFIVDRIELAGQGALYLQFQQLRDKLQAEGLFAPEHKKPRPQTIGKLGIVTGRSTAALQDMLKTIANRWPMMEITLFNASVQGSEAPAQIVRALEEADEAGMDAIILARGGGSFEDLFCFNDEQIARTLYGMKTYTVTGIGHEIDYTLADFAADHRSVTPTAAAQWVTLDQSEQRAMISNFISQMNASMKTLFSSASAKLMYLQGSSVLASPMSYVQSRKDALALLQNRLQSQFVLDVQKLNSTLERLDEQLFSQAAQYEAYQTNRLAHARTSLLLLSPKGKSQALQAKLDSLKEAMKQSAGHTLENCRMKLTGLQNMLDALSWQKTLERGFSIVVSQDHPVSDSRQLENGEPVQILLAKGSADATITALCHARKKSRQKS